ncbi:MAG: hypothetical protein NTX61_14315 [Bacteroidetes bacterium]|nr:hypothetical protein [Bacteroidota bacterium]
MELNQIDKVLSRLENDKANGRDHILSLVAALIEWMGIQPVASTMLSNRGSKIQSESNSQ